MRCIIVLLGAALACALRTAGLPTAGALFLGGNLTLFAALCVRWWRLR